MRMIKNFLVTVMLIFTEILKAQTQAPHAPHKVELRRFASPPVRTTDDEGVEMGRGLVERSETHLILTSLNGLTRVEVPRADLATPLINYAWQRVGEEYVYSYKITNRADSKAPIFSALLKSGGAYSNPLGLQPGQSAALVIKSKEQPVLQVMYIRSMGRSIKDELAAPGPEVTGDMAFDQFVTQHMLPHNNSVVVWVMGPGRPGEFNSETPDKGTGVAGLAFNRAQ